MALFPLITGARRRLYRFGSLASARFRDDFLSLQAMALTYSTLLSLVPFLAVTFSVLKAFGVQNFTEPFLIRMLEPLGPQAGMVTDRILNFVNNMQVRILGAVGLAALFYTVISLVSQMEDALNHIWRTPHARSWSQRVMAYLTAVLVGPVMVFTAFALTASAQSYWLVERLVQFKFVGVLFTMATSIMPFILLCLAFTLVYKLIPFTNVRLGAAVIGGATAGILWQVIGTGFTSFVASSTRYAAIYSSFAIVIVFLIWIYLGWLIFLIGGEVACFYQHPKAFLRESSNARAHAFQEWIALAALLEITRRHLSKKPPWIETELAASLGVSSLDEWIEKFVHEGILLRSAEPVGVALARPPESVGLNEVLDIVRNRDGFRRWKNPDTGAVINVLERRDQAVQRALDGMTLRSLALATDGKTLRVAAAGSSAQPL